MVHESDPGPHSMVDRVRERMEAARDQAQHAVATKFQAGSRALSSSLDRLKTKDVRLFTFDEIQVTELDAINKRRQRVRKEIERVQQKESYQSLPRVSDEMPAAGPPSKGPHPPDDVSTFSPRVTGGGLATDDPARPKPRMRNTVGLALSGGGIRSAAVCVGSLQALEKNGGLKSVDYLSTVSGGGYAGIATAAAMSATDGRFPYGDDSDVSDSKDISRLRNHTNFLLPRDRSGIVNYADVALLFMRGWLANLIFLAAGLLPLALLTVFAFPHPYSLGQRSYLAGLASEAATRVRAWPLDSGPAGWWQAPCRLSRWLVLKIDSALTNAPRPLLIFSSLLLIALVAWVVRRSLSEKGGNDVDSRILRLARGLLFAMVALVLLDAIPLALIGLHKVYAWFDTRTVWLWSVQAIPAVLSVLVTLFSSKLTDFLRPSAGDGKVTVILRQVMAKVALVVAALVLPFLVVLLFLHATSWLIDNLGAAGNVSPYVWYHDPLAWLLPSLALLAVITLVFGHNSYSLHQFYRDRLSRAFLAIAPKPASGRQMSPFAASAPIDDLEFKLLDSMKLTHLSQDACPYLIINAALNLQGSLDGVCDLPYPVDGGTLCNS